jgi:hypothetical protein
MTGEVIRIAPLAILIAALVAFTIVGLVRRSRTFVLVGLVIAAWLLTLYYEFPSGFPAWLAVTIRYGSTVALGAFLGVALVQEPVWLARRLGLVRRSPEWEYDVTLCRLRQAFDDKVQAATALGRATLERGEPPRPHDRDALRADAERILTTFRATPAPTAGWATLAAECVALFELSLEHFGEPIDEVVERRFLDGHTTSTALHEKLVAEYEAKARSQSRWP